MEDASNLHSYEDLAIEHTDRFKITQNKSSNAFQKLRDLRLENPKNILVSSKHNSIRNKFISSKKLVSSFNIDILRSDAT